VFYAESEQQPFVDVEVVTLKQHCLDLIIMEVAMREQVTDTNVDDKIRRHIYRTKEPISAREFVSGWYGNLSQTYHVQIGVNVQKINDDAVDYGMHLLSQIESFDNHLYQPFGRPWYFSPAQLLGELQL
jgi:hypothetical protein